MAEARPRVLIALPGAEAAPSLAGYLTAHGFDCVTVRDTEPALNRLEREHVDCVVCAARAPRLDSLAVLDRAREREQALCAVVVATGETRALALAAVRRGAYDYQLEPLDCQGVDGPDPIVLVQDYHFALLPAMLRERLPRATVIAFWHIPWPNAERFGICPWQARLLEGLLGSSVIGFHTQLHCNNFLESVDRFLESRIDRERQSIVMGGRETLVRPYPISVDWPNRWASEAPPVEACRREVFQELGLPPDGRLGVGVDRLDYTRGIEERLLAVERAMERFPSLRARTRTPRRFA